MALDPAIKRTQRLNYWINCRFYSKSPQKNHAGSKVENDDA
jgi:hypothetical protein